jgi:phage terminase large subunit-like protein
VAEIPDPAVGCTLALSASPRRDAAALVAVWPWGERLACRVVGVWEGVEQGELEDAVIECGVEFARAFAVDRVVGDPIQLDAAYRRLAEFGEWKGKTMSAGGMPQTDAFMEPASGALASAIESGKLAHDGDETLRRHVMACEAKDTRRGWRLARPQRVGERKAQSVEAAIALSMGVYALDVPQPAKPWVAVW